MLAHPAGRAGEHPRLRRRRPQPRQRGARRGLRLRTVAVGVSRALASARCSTSCRTTWRWPGRANPWWWDVLENGPASRYARLLRHRLAAGPADARSPVLVPVLGDQYGRVLEAGELAVVRDRRLVRGALLRPRPAGLASHAGRAAAAAAAEASGSRRAGAAWPRRSAPCPTRVDTEPQAVGERHRDKELLRERLDRSADGRRRGRGRRRRRGDAVNPDPDRLDALLDGRTTGWPTGAPPARSSTTGASSTSRRWSACGSRTRRSSPAPTGSSSTLVDGRRRRPAGRPRRRPARPGGLPASASPPATTAATRGGEDPRGRRGAAAGVARRRHHGLRLPQPGQRPVRRPSTTSRP